MNAANVTLICRGGRDLALEAADNRFGFFILPARAERARFRRSPYGL